MSFQIFWVRTSVSLIGITSATPPICSTGNLSLEWHQKTYAIIVLHTQKLLTVFSSHNGIEISFTFRSWYSVSTFCTQVYAEKKKAKENRKKRKRKQTNKQTRSL